MLIDLFINAGWYTVPMEGELKRLEDGSKTLPELEYGWRKKYSTQRNEKRTLCAGSMTGASSGIIAIDCDNQVTFDLFRSLDPKANFMFISKGKPSGGGTLIYKYSDELSTNFKLSNDNIKLDFYSNNGFIYLPTEHNYTKESWADVKELPELRDVPATILAVLKTFKEGTEKNIYSDTNKPRTVVSNRLAPMLEKFVKSKQYDPVLFKILTPRDFRELPAYIVKGHLHPNDVPVGRGSEYLSKISAILGADISVNVELYGNTLLAINSLWDSPMEKSRLMSTIITPMVDGKTAIDGNQVWHYDPHWEQLGFVATAINGDYLESFYDDVKGLYYLINYSFPYIKTYSDKRPILTTLKTLLGRNVTETIYDTTKQIIRTYVDPTVEFGHVEGKDVFNLFKQSIELNILNNPYPYRTEYKRPNNILNFFETLIPDDFTRAYTLSFIRTKLTTFKYSPIVLYFIGVPGSGKDTFVNLFRMILGNDYVTKPDTKVFLEQYNGWLVDKLIVQLDEYGNKLTRYSEKQEVLGKIKAYTGFPEIQVRAMRQEGFNYRHTITFISTANSNPLPIEDEDRRVLYIKTPHKLEKARWVIELGGVTTVQEKIKEEIKDFCYYLATEVKNLSGDDYVIAPLTGDKEDLIFNGMSAADQINFCITKGKYELLKDLFIEYGINEFNTWWDNNRLLDEKLAELYEVMTEGAGSHRKLLERLRDSGITRSHTTSKGLNIFYFNLQGLSDIRVTAQEEGIFPDRTLKGID